MIFLRPHLGEYVRNCWLRTPLSPECASTLYGPRVAKRPSPKRRQTDAPAAGHDSAAHWATAIFIAGTVAIVPGGLNRFVIAKFAVVCVAAVIAWGGAQARGRLDPVIQVCLALGASFLLLATILSADPVTQFLGRGPRYEGVLGLSVYVIALGLGARLLGPARSQRDVDVAIQALSIAVLIVVALAVLEGSGLRPLASNVSRPLRCCKAA